MKRSRLPLYALLASSALSSLAEAVSIVAIPWFVLDLTGSYAKMGIVGFFTFLPRVIALFLGGQVVDRVGFRRAAVLSDVLSGISVCGIPLLYAAGHLTFEGLIALVVLGAFFDGPGATARDALVPELAERAEIGLDKVNSFFQGTRRLAIFVGPALAGVLIGVVGPSNVLWANAIFFALSVTLMILWVPGIRPAGHDNERLESLIDNTLYGWRYLRKDRLLLFLAAILCVMNFLDAPLATVQFPALVHSRGGSATQLGLLLSSFGAGAVAGAAAFAMVGNRVRRHTAFAAGFFVVGVGMLTIALAPIFPLALGTTFLMGLAAGPVNPVLMSVRQERVPLASRARVFGTFSAICMLAIPLGQLAGGVVVEQIDPRASLGVTAFIYLGMVAFVMLSPRLRELDDPMPAVELRPDRLPKRSRSTHPSPFVGNVVDQDVFP